MKKIVSWFALFAIALVGLTLPALAEESEADEVMNSPVTAVPVLYNINNSSSTLERIPSPDQIRYYKVMKNENGALYGVRLNGEPRSNSDSSEVEMDDDSLEKIPSPDQIRYYKVIKKENGSLYGIRLNNNGSGNSSNSNSNANSVSKVEDSELEKIPSPDQIRYFKVIKKENGSLYGIRIGDKDQVKPENDIDEVKTKRMIVTSEMLACVSSAIDKKDEALKTRIAVAATELKSAIEARNACQKNALSSEDSQYENIDKCATEFKEANKAMVERNKESQNNAWKTYGEELKACHSETSGDEEIIINDGGSSSVDTVMVQ